MTKVLSRLWNSTRSGAKGLLFLCGLLIKAFVRLKTVNRSLPIQLGLSEMPFHRLFASWKLYRQPELDSVRRSQNSTQSVWDAFSQVVRLVKALPSTRIKFCQALAKFNTVCLSFSQVVRLVKALPSTRIRFCQALARFLLSFLSPIWLF
jgi:hypothetical protein